MTDILALAAAAIFGFCMFPLVVMLGDLLKQAAPREPIWPEPAWKALGRLAQKEPPLRGTVRPNGTERA